MQNLLRRGNTWFARLTLPRDRWGDVGRAYKAASGVKREVVRTLQTTDRREAGTRLKTALAAIQAEVEDRLRAAGLAPLTAWKVTWMDRAGELRGALREADDEKLLTATYVETEQDLLRDTVKDEADRLEGTLGYPTAAAFYKAATTYDLTLAEAANLWLEQEARSLKQKTIAGHRAVLKQLDTFLREKDDKRSIRTATLDDVSRRLAGEFIAWRAEKVSPAAVKREFSTPMGLWRWAVRRGHTEANPWTDQTAGLGRSATGDDDSEDAKRPFSAGELVHLLTATGEDWAPNGGGYGATLWDALRLGLLTGCRAAELADLRMRHVVGAGTAVSIRQGKTKNARRIVPLPEAAQTVLAMRLADLLDTSPDAPLWPEIPVLKVTGSRGGKLSSRFQMARERLLPDAMNVDLHSLRRSYATALEAAMNKGGLKLKLKLPRFRGVVRDLVVTVLPTRFPLLLRMPWAIGSRARNAASPGCTNPR
jgi:integrase